MIGSLRGVLTERRPLGDAAVDLVVDVGGVGYRLVVAPRTAAGLLLGHEAAFAVHTHVREGAITLYGFASSEERTAFELLLGAHGVGPGLALAILGIHDPGELAEVIATGNVDALRLVPGVGQKTAARLLLELQARFDYLNRRRFARRRSPRTEPAALGGGRGRRCPRSARLRARRGPRGAAHAARGGKRGRAAPPGAAEPGAAQMSRP